MKLFVRSVFFASIAVGLGIAGGCGDDGSTFGDGSGKDGGSSGSSGSSGNFGGDGSAVQTPPACTNLCLKQQVCSGGKKPTSISGVIRDPAGKLPVYNVLVYVPNAPVGPLTEGAVCDRCGKVSGEPLVSTLTKVDGSFTLEDVPVDTDFPLVIQIGKWRRQIPIPKVANACADNTIDDPANLRLPAKKSEGDMPLIALTTGGLDTMECWLRKIGIDDSEFTTGSGDGRVRLYKGSGPPSAQPTSAFDATHNGGAAFTSATDLWSSVDNLKKYDMVIMSCEGETAPETKPPAALQAMKDYGNLGGRIFASHWHRYWFNTAQRDELGNHEDAGPPSPFDPVATWTDHPDPNRPGYAAITTTLPDNTPFVKGQALKDWLALPGVGGIVDFGPPTGQKLVIDDPRHNVDAVNEHATSWLTLPNDNASNATAHEFVTWNMPVGAPDDQLCGRTIYSDLHVTTSTIAGQHNPWPSSCGSNDMSPQEKTLEFMLFDLSSCVQNDAKPPAPPVN